jgi:hypothetical protein
MEPTLKNIKNPKFIGGSLVKQYFSNSSHELKITIKEAPS